MTAPAIVSGGYFAPVLGVYRQLPVQWCIGDLAELAWMYKISDVIVLDGWDDNRAMHLAGLDVKELGRPPLQWIVKVPRRPEVTVTAVQAVVGGTPWEDVGPRVALGALEAWERRTGTPWSSTISRTAEHLIIDSWKGKRAFLEHRPVPAPIERAAIASAEQPYTWARDLFEEEQGRKWVHVFDINAQHLHEWRATRLPYDEVRHEVRPHLFDPTVPGLWRIPELAETSRGIFRTDLPSVLHGTTDVHSPGREWFTTWTLHEAGSRGLSLPAVTESITWAKSHAWLAHAGGRLAELRARAALDKRIVENREHEPSLDQTLTELEQWEVAHLVGKLAKRVYQVETGMFAAASEAGAAMFHRPIWWAYIVGAARVRLYRKMDHWKQPPFAVLTDAVMFATDEPDPAAFALANGLELSQEVGAFSHRQTALLPELRRDAESIIAAGYAASMAWPRALRVAIERTEVLR